MSERITEQQLLDFESGAERFLREFVTATDLGATAMAESSFVVIAQGLVAEVRRLRGLVEMAADEVPSALDRSVNGHRVLAEADAIRAETSGSSLWRG